MDKSLCSPLQGELASLIEFDACFYLPWCDRTTSKMRDPPSKIQIGWFSTKRECMQTYIRSIQNHNFIENKLLHFSLKITRMRSRRCFKRENMFVEAFHSTIQGIHLVLKLKTSFDNSTPVMGSVRNPVLRSMDFHWQPSSASPKIREEEEPAYKKLQSKAWESMLSKTDPSWPSSQTSIHAKASSGKGYISLQPLALNTFKHVISQV
jgi:hypothetical protein